MAKAKAQQQQKEEAEEIWDLLETCPEDCNKSCSGKEGKCKKVPVAIWTSNLQPQTYWYACETCQEEEFGGWPDESNKEKQSSTEDGEKVSSTTDKPDKDENNKDLSDNKECISSPQKKKENEPVDEPKTETPEVEGEEEQWNFTKIISLKDLTSSSSTMCNTSDCMLQACSIWKKVTPTTTTEGEELWYTCIDCQDVDFGGWPIEEDLKEFPQIKDELMNLTQEHLNEISERCSREDRPKLPPQQQQIMNKAKDEVITSPDHKSNKKTMIENHVSSACNVTPPPASKETSTTSSSSSTTTHKTKSKTHNNNKSAVTPSPTSILPNNEMNNNNNKSKSKSKQPSATAIAMHRKWQEAAESMGGKNARIIVSKPAAKQLIFEFLKDQFKPMNITEIYNSLKAVVPSPVLKSCLDDMVENSSLHENPFDNDTDSDDDEDGSSGSKKKKNNKKGSSSSSSSNNADPYTESLLIKVGRNASSTLYFVNYNKLPNNGNGMELDERSEFMSISVQTNEELNTLTKEFHQINSQTKTLLDQPQNEELDQTIQDLSKEIETLSSKMNHLKQYEGNEEKRKLLHQNISHMSTIWRKRRRMTKEFLLMMEEATDGAITVKKSFRGDTNGLDVESDEYAIAQTKEWIKMKRGRHNNNSMRMMNKKKASTGGNSSSVVADETFIGVTMNVQGKVERVYMESDNA
eukprot:CAMPEP_0178967614 /NCGR_PEP_ID=MMETSP0789-20121207/17712_1 /TAXON_ID=3005 /ORGANISM="Rhizosolenia setigera, Strain CCMP 1694" /LENGTH=691 /DNA_ID=CAMNT_0020653283 /DNA_START=210 /DNA_END=2285 /DNA_ORIENTATION=+